MLCKEKLLETFYLFCVDKFSKGVALEEWIRRTQCQMWTHENTMVTFPGHSFVPAVVQVNQMKIYNVPWKIYF